MNKYYVGQKLLCITTMSYFTLNGIYTIVHENRTGYFIIDDDGEEGSIYWPIDSLDERFIDATKHLSEQAFNTKFDDWINNE